MAKVVHMYFREYKAEGRRAFIQHQIGRELLKVALQREYHVPFLEEMLSFGENGKPYLKDKTCYFSISHCEGMVICAVADWEIGVDVETDRLFGDSLIERVCGEIEKQYLKENRNRFLEFWTLKESYVKMTGKGLRENLAKIEFSFKDELALVQKKERNSTEIKCSQSGCFYQYMWKKYIVALSSTEAFDEVKIFCI